MDSESQWSSPKAQKANDKAKVSANRPKRMKKSIKIFQIYSNPATISFFAETES